MSGYPHNYGYGYGAPPPSSTQPYGTSAPPPYGTSAPSPYGAPPQTAQPYGAPPPPGQSSYAPVGNPYSTVATPSAPPYSSDPTKPPKDNKPYGASAPSSAGPYGAPPPGPYGAPSAPYGSPFASLVPSAFPPGTDPNLIACFQIAYQDGSGFIDDKELQRALSSYNQSFSLSTVHLLMYLFTNSNARKIGPKEFTSLFYSLQNWRAVVVKLQELQRSIYDLYIYLLQNAFNQHRTSSSNSNT